MKPDLYRKASVAWSYGGSQDLEQWVTLGHTALQLLYSAPFPDPCLACLKNVPFAWSPCIFPSRPNVDTCFIKHVWSGPRVPPAPCVGRLFELECQTQKNGKDVLSTSFPFFWVPPLTNVGRFDVELLRESFSFQGHRSNGKTPRGKLKGGLGKHGNIPPLTNVGRFDLEISCCR
ncbi:hypothetical protein TNCT_620281 [Trichonephila clavata]|uniref:Uncharacterized protein n=1 Tax=Trichonephila clavata TaxID=2740835 RepID=A0A8X6KKC8_TRICU|nr:hypothetical protein TNCT_620281 [Trichonephila clavata]